MSATGSEPALPPLSSPLSSLSSAPISPSLLPSPDLNPPPSISPIPRRPKRPRDEPEPVHQPVPSSSSSKCPRALPQNKPLKIHPVPSPADSSPANPPKLPRRKYKPRVKKTDAPAVVPELQPTLAGIEADDETPALVPEFDHHHHRPDRQPSLDGPEPSRLIEPDLLLPVQVHPPTPALNRDTNRNAPGPNGTQAVSVRLTARAPRYRTLPTTAPRLAFPARASPSGTTTRTAIAPRLYTDSQGARSLPGHLKSYGPLWEPPAYVHPSYQPGTGWTIKREPVELNPVVRRRMQAAEADLLYGPAMDLLCDLGWYKNKWDKDRQCENEHWGGWFDHLTSELGSVLDAMLPDDQASEYLPTGITIPAPVKEPASWNPQLIIRSKLENDWAVDSDLGSLNILAGPLKVVGSVNGRQVTTQDQVKFERFAGCNLSTDTMPVVHLHRSARPLRADYLAVSTISHDPGLLPPSDIRSRTKDVKSVVQIWRVPFIEPAYFGGAANNGAGSGEKESTRREEHDFSAYSAADMNVWADTSEQEQSARHEEEEEDEEEEDGPSLALLLAVPSQAVCVRWCPRGGSEPIARQDGGGGADYSDNNVQTSFGQQVLSLGILAVSLLDGSVGLYSIPHPTQVKDHAFNLDRTSNRALTLELEPVVKLLIPKGTSCLSLDWANHDILAGGCMNGSIAIWHIHGLLATLSSSTQHMSIRPTHLIPQHAAPIRSLAWIKTPPVDQHGRPMLDGDPSFLSSTGYDGSVKVCDTMAGAGNGSIVHERGETTSLHFSPPLGCLHFADSDYSIKAVCLRPRDFGISKKILVQLGLMWQIAGSDFHSFIAYGAADGVCGLASLIRAQKYRSRATMWAPKVYQLDFNRNQAVLRMLDNLVPEPRSQDGTAVISDQNKKVQATLGSQKSSKSTGIGSGGGVGGTGTRKKKGPEMKKAELPSQSTSPIGTYTAPVGVHCVCWSPTVSRGSVLASGTGSGLVRVDAVEGSWNGQRMRFGSIEALVEGGVRAFNANGGGDGEMDQAVEEEEEEGLED